MTRLKANSIVTTLFAGMLLATAGVIAMAAAPRDSTPTISRAYLHSYNLPSSGLALEGYCPVSYFSDNAARRGTPEHASTYNGVDYWFVSAKAKRAFDIDPEKYIPAYGGWCAYGMAVRDKFPIDPTAFKIVNGRLMVFLRNANVDALALWNKNDEQDQVAEADLFWKKVSR